MSQFEYTTTLNGGVVDVFIKVKIDRDPDGTHTELSLDAVIFEGVDIMKILSKETLDGLEMEAELGYWNSVVDSKNGY
jgi:hypothetical protein